MVYFLGLLLMQTTSEPLPLISLMLLSKSSLFIPLLNPGASTSVQRSVLYFHPTNKWAPSDSITIGNTHLPVEHSVKCMGVWWDSAPFSKCSLMNGLARPVQLSSRMVNNASSILSSRSIVECCALPVLMYGSDSWLLNSTLLSRLESFQAEQGKCILKLPKYTSIKIPLLVLNWTSMCASKLSFLHKVSQGQTLSILCPKCGYRKCMVGVLGCSP